MTTPAPSNRAPRCSRLDGTSAPDAAPPTARDAGTTGPTGGGGHATPVGGSHGGCSVAPGEAQPATSLVWSGALLLIVLGLRRRRAKPPTS